MTTATHLPDSGPKSAGPVKATARRLMALSKAELKLLLRNRMALFMTLGMPIAFALMIAGMDIVDDLDISIGAMMILMVTGFATLFVVYYNLVATFAARREELVLKRLRTGELSDAEILSGTASASLATALAQIVVVVIAVPLLFEMSAPTNPILIILGVLTGIAIFVPLAAVSAVFTRNAEMAQLTTLPIIMICFVFGGFTVPLSVMPDWLARIAEVLPLTPSMELMRMGLLGETNGGETFDFASSFGPAVLPLVIAVAWMVIGVLLVRRYFRWEPRQ